MMFHPSRRIPVICMPRYIEAFVAAPGGQTPTNHFSVICHPLICKLIHHSPVERPIKDSAELHLSGVE